MHGRIGTHDPRLEATPAPTGPDHYMLVLANPSVPGHGLGMFTDRSCRGASSTTDAIGSSGYARGGSTNACKGLCRGRVAWIVVLGGAASPAGAERVDLASRLAGISDPARSLKSATKFFGRLFGTQILHAVGPVTAYLSFDGEDAYGMLRSSDEYRCFAARHKLRDWLPVDKIFGYHTRELAAPAFCDLNIAERPQLPTNATNWILRESTGTAWFIDDHSQMGWIRDGGVYQCLTRKAHVLDLTPWSEITRFEGPQHASDAACT